jgi:hypothetical protein
MPRPKNVKPIQRVAGVRDAAETEQVVDAIQDVKADPSPQVVDSLGWRDTYRQCTKSVDALDGAGRQIIGGNGRPIQQMRNVTETVRIRSSLLSVDEARLFDKAGWKRFSSQWTRKALSATGMRRLVIDNDVYEAL